MFSLLCQSAAGDDEELPRRNKIKSAPVFVRLENVEFPSQLRFIKVHSNERGRDTKNRPIRSPQNDVRASRISRFISSDKFKPIDARDKDVTRLN